MSFSIEELRAKRQRWVDANKENNFEGVRKLLTDLYPDNAHFIYELLQNAEDAKATKVYFELGFGNIKFKHNGQRLFNLKDIDSITSIGSSTKKDDNTSIGKFGVGFKAVFAYTDSPEIHSGEYHFSIHELVLPITAGVERIQLDKDETLFNFPFNNENKTPEQAVQEITRGLLALSANTLLFLNNIKQIDFKLPDKSYGSLKFSKTHEGYVKIQKTTPKKVEPDSSHWLLYENNVDINDNGEIKNCRIAIAYGLQKEFSKKEKKAFWKVVPVEHGQVSIFFPAEKETSKLRFHIHAPFASTVARDSVRDCEANTELREKIAELITASLSDIKEKKLLTLAFLSVLPIKEDTLFPEYEPIRQGIIKAFQELELTPTRNGGHAAAKELYRGSARIASELGENGLKFFTNSTNAQWAANPTQRNQRDDRFLDSLEIESWNYSELIGAMNKYSSEKKESLECFISEKTDNELMKFYALIAEALKREPYSLRINKNLKFLRSQHEKNDIHIDCEHVFLESSHNGSFDDILFVKKKTYMDDDGENEEIIKLFKYIGVKYICEEEIVKSILKMYPISGNFDEEKHINDLTVIVNFLNNPDVISKIDMFKAIGFSNMNPEIYSLYMHKDKKFILGENENKELYWCAANSIFIDLDFHETKLSNFIDIHENFSLWSGYKNYLSEEYIIKNLIPCIKRLGAIDALEITSAPLYLNPQYSDLYKGRSSARETHTGVKEDWTIHNIDKYIELKDIHASKLIWEALINAQPRHSTARYSPNQQHSVREVESQLVYKLKISAWIPDNNSTFRTPEDMTRNCLRDDFIYNNMNGLLSAIEFGVNEHKQMQEKAAQQLENYERNVKAQELGFENNEEAQQFAKLGKVLHQQGISIDEFVAGHCNKKSTQKPSFPNKHVQNLERRQEHIDEQYAQATDIQYEEKPRSVRISGGSTKASAEQWLRESYTNEEGVMVCQICKDEMPFKKRDGKHYFEKVEILSTSFISKEHEAKYLALCPICSAKYKYFIKKSDDEMQNIVENICDTDLTTDEISIALGDELASIRFVQSHLVDIKTIIES